MHTNAPHPALKTGPLLAQVIAACVAGALLGAAAAYISGWGAGDLQTIATATLVPMTVWIIAAAIGAMLLSVVTHKEPAKLGLGVLASSTARMLISLMVGVLLYFLMSLEGRCFWTSFLLAGLFALVAETTWAIRIINASRVAAETGVR
jgi:hypothetical protein